MRSRDINARMSELEGTGKSLEEALRGQPALDPESHQSPNHPSLGRRLANESSRSVDPRKRVAMSRVSEFLSG